MNYDNIIYPLDKIYSNATGVGYPVCGAGHDTPPTPVVEGYFYIENTYDGDNVVTIKARTLTDFNYPIPVEGTYATELEYSKDGENWTTFQITSDGGDITIARGEKLYLRNDSGYFSFRGVQGRQTRFWGIMITATQTNNAGGPLTSLVDYRSDELPGRRDGLFANLFRQNTNLVSAGNIVIPTDLKGSENIFMGLFNYASSLTTLPDFSNITSIGKGAMNGVFSYCSSLTTPPDFSGLTEIPESGMYGAFSDCSSLTTTPDFSNVTSVGAEGFKTIFVNCQSLTTPPDFSNITSAGVDAFDWAFRDCTSLTSGPDFSKITTWEGSQIIFDGCSNLSSVIAPSVQSWDTTKFHNWLVNAGTNVQGTKTVYAPTGVTIPTDSNSGIPTGWVRVDY